MALLLEIILLLSFFVIYPLYGRMTFARVRQELERGSLSRLEVFREVLLVQWLATALLAALWWLTERQAAALGLVFEGGSKAWLAWALVTVPVAFTAMQALWVGRRAELRRSVREQLESVRPMMPHNRRELSWFFAVSVTAGICEEVLYRGFLLWWLATPMDLGLVWAAILSTIAFGLAHAYQGVAGMVKTGALGGVMVGLRILAGSIWPVVVLHALLDILGGIMAHAVLTAPQDDDSEPTRQGHLPATDP